MTELNHRRDGMTGCVEIAELIFYSPIRQLPFGADNQTTASRPDGARPMSLCRTFFNVSCTFPEGHLCRTLFGRQPISQLKREQCCVIGQVLLPVAALQLQQFRPLCPSKEYCSAATRGEPVCRQNQAGGSTRREPAGSCHYSAAFVC